VMFGEVTNEKNLAMKDMSPRELVVVAPLIVLALAMGLYPKPFFDMMHASVAATIKHVPPATIAQAGHRGDAHPRPKLVAPTVSYEVPNPAGAGAIE